MKRVESKVVPKNVTLNELLKPRNVLVKPENILKWEQQKEAEDYMEQMYGTEELDGTSNMDPNVREILDLALGETLVEMPQIIPIHKVSYRLELGFKNGVYVGSTNEIPVKIISDSAIPSKPRIFNQDESDILSGVLELLESKEKNDNAALKKKAILLQQQKALAESRIDSSDSESDIFEDAGTDYVLETRKPSDRGVESREKQKYFKESLEEKDSLLNINFDIPEGLGASSNLKQLLENSHKQTRLANNGEGESSDSENSIQMLEDIAPDDGINYDYEQFYSDDDEPKSKLASELDNSGSKKSNQEFQKISKVYESKFGVSINEKKEGKKRSTVEVIGERGGGGSIKKPKNG